MITYAIAIKFSNGESVVSYFDYRLFPLLRAPSPLPNVNYFLVVCVPAPLFPGKAPTEHIQCVTTNTKAAEVVYCINGTLIHPATVYLSWQPLFYFCLQ